MALPMRRRSRLWIRVGVSGCSDRPQGHHGVIFMHQVVAVHGITSQEIAEAEEDLHRLVVAKLNHVLTRFLDCQRRRSAIAGNDLVLLKVDMNRMHPASGAVDQGPQLGGVLSYGEPVDAAIGELAVDLPLSVAALEV